MRLTEQRRWDLNPRAVAIGPSGDRNAVWFTWPIPPASALAGVTLQPDSGTPPLSWESF